MFKNIQKKILLKYPLIWNTKFVPMLFIGILFQILYFGIGYLNGSIDFTGKKSYDIEITSIMFGVLLVVLILIIWLYYYLKNNALKSFYNKSKNALFYEWFQIFVICFLLVSFYLPFKIGEHIHERSYFSKEEATKRCKTIGLADLFIDGYFDNTEVDSLNSILKDTLIEGEYQYRKIIHKDSMEFEGKKYFQFSIINRKSHDFSLISREEDSLNVLQVKKWLITDNKDEIKSLMNNYLQLVNEHQLKTNLTTEKWFNEVYKYPDFTAFSYIKPYFKEYEAENNYETSAVAVYESDNYNEHNNKYSNYFVQQDVLKSKYYIVSKAHTNTLLEYRILLTFLCGALGLSLLLFSFKVTSGKSWLIAIVTVGVLNILFGIFMLFIHSDFTYFYMVLGTFTIFKIYFFRIYIKKRSIGFSKVILNILLWSFPFMIPLIYFMIMQYFRPFYNIHDKYTYNPTYTWMNENITNMISLNFLFCVITLFFISRIIRNWKSIADE